MSSGYSNAYVRQIGEYLACAELARQRLFATSFTGNVPEYDLLVCNEKMNSVAVQVKASTTDTWISKATDWMEIEIDEKKKRQKYLRKRRIFNPDLIYILVAVGKSYGEDNFLICQKKDIQKACILSYRRYMDPKKWVRPKNYRSLDNRYHLTDLIKFKNNWDLIHDLLN